MAVRTKSRLRANKSNILLACIAVSDLAVGVIVQSMFIAVTTSVFVGKRTIGACALNLSQYCAQISYAIRRILPTWSL